jgi:hypothetical protein
VEPAGIWEALQRELRQRDIEPELVSSYLVVLVPKG